MYTILHIHCIDEITKATQESAKILGRNFKTISCHSLEDAKKHLMGKVINCVIADLCNNSNETVLLLENWQKSIDYCRNAIILLADDENILLNIFTRIHFCEIYLNETTEKRNEMIAAFIRCHYALHQRLYHPSFLKEGIDFKTSEGNRRCTLNDILYIETFNHKCLLHTKKESFAISKPLCTLKKYPLFSKFKQSHRSFLVNPIHIMQIDTSSCPWVISFKDCSKQAFVSRSFQKSFE